MPKVITPDSAGLGNYVTKAANTPFQSFSVPVLDGGAKALKAIGAGIGDVAEAGIAIRAKDDARAQARLTAQQKALRAEMITDPSTGLAAYKGQEALDRISGTIGGGHPGARESFNEQYKRRLNDLVEDAGLSSGAREDAAIDQLGWETSFGALTNEAQLTQQNVVDAQLSAEAVAGAVTTAVTKISSYPNDAVGTAQKSAAMDEGLEAIKSAVMDPVFGMAKQQGITDATQKKSLVKAQQALLVEATVKSLLQSEDPRQAYAMLKKQMAPEDANGDGGILLGTATGTALMSATATVRESLEGKQLYSEVAKKYPNDTTAQLTAIMSNPDVLEQGMMLTAFKAQNALNNIIRRDSVGKETLALVRFVRDNPGVAVKASAYPALSQYEPRLIFEAVQGRVRSAAKSLNLDAFAAAHVSSGGSAVGSKTVTENLSRLADKDPDQFIKLMDNPANIKSFTNAGEWATLSSKLATATKKQMDALSGTIQYDSVLKDLGFKASSTSYKALLFDPRLTEALTDKRRQIWEDTGKKATLDDLTPTIARFAVPVDKSMAIQPTLYSLSEYAKQGVNHKDLNDTPLDYDTKSSYVRLHHVFGQMDKPPSPLELKELIDVIDNTDAEVTLNKIAAALSEQPDRRDALLMLDLPAAEQAEMDFTDSTLALGYPPAFIRTVLDQKQLGHSDKNLHDLDKEFKANTQGYTEFFKAWAAGEFD